MITFDRNEMGKTSINSQSSIYTTICTINTNNFNLIDCNKVSIRFIE